MRRAVNRAVVAEDVGHQVGYLNLSNFSIAFKKEFDCLPGKFVQLHNDLSFVKLKRALFPFLKSSGLQVKDDYNDDIK